MYFPFIFFHFTRCWKWVILWDPNGKRHHRKPFFAIVYVLQRSCLHQIQLLIRRSLIWISSHLMSWDSIRVSLLMITPDSSLSFHPIRRNTRRRRDLMWCGKARLIKGIYPELSQNMIYTWWDSSQNKSRDNPHVIWVMWKSSLKTVTTRFYYLNIKISRP